MCCSIRDEKYIKKYTFPIFVALRLIPVHVNVQFDGFLLTLKNNPGLCFQKNKKNKKNKTQSTFSRVHPYVQFGPIFFLAIHAVLKRPAPFP